MTAPRAQSVDPPAQAFQTAAAAFAMLSSAVRLHILWLLAQRDRYGSEIASAIGGTPQVVSQQMAKLKQAGVVQVRQEGRKHIYSISDPHLHAVAALMIAHLSPGPGENMGAPGDTA
jgi:DNA-binding transcriptional ArsR family regulator